MEVKQQSSIQRTSNSFQEIFLFEMSRRSKCKALEGGRGSFIANTLCLQ